MLAGGPARVAALLELAEIERRVERLTARCVGAKRPRAAETRRVETRLHARLAAATVRVKAEYPRRHRAAAGEWLLVAQLRGWRLRAVRRAMVEHANAQAGWSGAHQRAVIEETSELASQIASAALSTSVRLFKSMPSAEGGWPRDVRTLEDRCAQAWRRGCTDVEGAKR